MCSILHVNLYSICRVIDKVDGTVQYTKIEVGGDINDVSTMHNCVAQCTYVDVDITLIIRYFYFLVTFGLNT